MASGCSPEPRPESIPHFLCVMLDVFGLLVLTIPFVIGDLVVIALLIAFPEIALWLPRQMG